jgi:hypothetical protein
MSSAGKFQLKILCESLVLQKRQRLLIISDDFTVTIVTSCPSIHLDDVTNTVGSVKTNGSPIEMQDNFRGTARTSLLNLRLF